MVYGYVVYFENGEKPVVVAAVNFEDAAKKVDDWMHKNPNKSGWPIHSFERVGEHI
jgi:hypothetical protein